LAKRIISEHFVSFNTGAIRGIQLIISLEICQTALRKDEIKNTSRYQQVRYFSMKTLIFTVSNSFDIYDLFVLLILVLRPISLKQNL